MKCSLDFYGFVGGGLCCSTLIPTVLASSKVLTPDPVLDPLFMLCIFCRILCNTYSGIAFQSPRRDQDANIILARAQVHLQTVLNYFRDNDFLLETSTPKDITLDNIARLTNSTSTSTINSNKKSKRLTDIMEESPIIGAGGELLDVEDGESSPSASSVSGTTSSMSNRTDEGESTVTAPSTKTAQRSGHKLSLTPVSRGGQHALVSPPTTPRSHAPSGLSTSSSAAAAAKLRQPPSPTTTSSEHQRDSYDSITSPRSTPTNSPTPVTPTNSSPPSLPLTPPTPPSPSKLRLLKALEMRRLKMSGQPVVLVSKTFELTHHHHHFEHHPAASRTEKPATPPPEPVSPRGVGTADHKMRLQAAKKAALAAKRAVLEEQKRHIAELEGSGRDLLSGWVNFQSSTSLVPPPIPRLKTQEICFRGSAFNPAHMYTGELTVALATEVYPY